MALTDHVAAALSSGLIDHATAARLLLAARQDADPWADLTGDARVDAIVRGCGAGAMAELPPRTVLVRGQRIPTPPGRHKPNHAPRARRPRTETPP